jgi:hypothetical protein
MQDDSKIEDVTSYGEASYRGYAEYTGGKTFNGKDMPKWSELPENIQDAWRCATIIGAGILVEDGKDASRPGALARGIDLIKFLPKCMEKLAPDLFVKEP